MSLRADTANFLLKTDLVWNYMVSAYIQGNATVFKLHDIKFDFSNISEIALREICDELIKMNRLETPTTSRVSSYTLVTATIDRNIAKLAEEKSAERPAKKSVKTNSEVKKRALPSDNDSISKPKKVSHVDAESVKRMPVSNHSPALTITTKKPQREAEVTTLDSSDNEMVQRVKYEIPVVKRDEIREKIVQILLNQNKDGELIPFETIQNASLAQGISESALMSAVQWLEDNNRVMRVDDMITII